MVEVHSGPLAAQTEDPETISTGEVKNNSVDLVEGALTLTGIKSFKNVSLLHSGKKSEPKSLISYLRTKRATFILKKMWILKKK